MTKTGVTTIDDNGDVTLVVVFRFYRLEFLCLTAAQRRSHSPAKSETEEVLVRCNGSIVSFSIFTWLGKTKKNTKKDSFLSHNETAS